MDAPTVIVEVSAPKAPGLPALEMRDVNAWARTPCVLPCTLRLDPRSEYRISGTGVVDSDPFRLPLGADRVRVDVSAGSTPVHALGTAFTIAGLLFAVGGGAVLLLPAGDNDKGAKTVVGVGFISVGVLTAAVGMALRVFSDTSVGVLPGEQAAR
jgi:hypothetical protein